MKKELQDRLMEESNLSLQQLKIHIRSNHPMKELDTQWPLMMYVGSLFSLDYNSIETGFHKDIGLGPALYLLTLKALGQIFLLLTILNLPAMFIFSRG